MILVNFWRSQDLTYNTRSLVALISATNSNGELDLSPSTSLFNRNSVKLKGLGTGAVAGVIQPSWPLRLPLTSHPAVMRAEDSNPDREHSMEALVCHDRVFRLSRGQIFASTRMSGLLLQVATVETTPQCTTFEYKIYPCRSSSAITRSVS